LSGIALFTFSNFIQDYRPLAIMGISCLRLHTCNVAVIFHHLREIILIREEDLEVTKRTELKKLEPIADHPVNDLPTIKLQEMSSNAV
jgi:hypothetical protein